ncbi:hypothetical protein OA501_00255 [Flavobacteriaceae bacterium]|nr:hypothetical protein [Flavobacteriaceae bacterium]
MKKMKLLSGILIGLIILSSCSNDDDSASTNDIIIGKWRAIERFESNVQVDLPVCLPHLCTEYNADKSIRGDKIITNDFPQECGTIDFELGWNWNNLGNNQYKIRYLEEQGQIFTFYKEGQNLVEENPDGITKTIYETY